MAKTTTATTRVPRGTKSVAEAFFTAVNEIPESQQAGVVKAALALIRDRLKETRDKAKLAKQKTKGPSAPVASKAVAPPKAVAKKPLASESAKKPPAKATARRGRAPQMKTPKPVSTPTDEKAMPNEA